MSLVTGPDSRVASSVGGKVEIPVQMACRPPPLHPFSQGREGSGCCEVWGIWPISQAEAPSTAAGQGSSWSSRPEYRCFPHTRGESEPLSPLLGCGSLGTGHTSPTGLPAAMCKRPAFSSCAQCLWWLTETTHSCTIWKPDRRRPPTCSNTCPSQGHCHHPPASANKAGLGGPAGLAASFTPQTPAGQWDGMGVFCLGL